MLERDPHKWRGRALLPEYVAQDLPKILLTKQHDATSGSRDWMPEWEQDSAKNGRHAS